MRDGAVLVAALRFSTAFVIFSARRIAGVLSVPRLLPLWPENFRVDDNLERNRQVISN